MARRAAGGADLPETVRETRRTTAGGHTFQPPPGGDRIWSVISVRPSTSRRIAWVVGLLSIALLVGALVVLFVDRHAALGTDSNRWSFSAVLGEVGNIAVAVTGMVIALRRPRHTLGWVSLVAGLSLALQDFGSAYSQHALQ